MRISVVTFVALAAASPIMQLRDGHSDSAPAYYSAEPTSAESYSSKPSNVSEGGNGANGGSNTTSATPPSSTEGKGQGSSPAGANPTGTLGGDIPDNLPVPSQAVGSSVPSVISIGTPDLPTKNLPLPAGGVPSLGGGSGVPALPIGNIGSPLGSIVKNPLPLSTSISTPDLPKVPLGSGLIPELPSIGSPLGAGAGKLPIPSGSSSGNPLTLPVSVPLTGSKLPNIGVDLPSIGASLPSLGGGIGLPSIGSGSKLPSGELPNLNLPDSGLTLDLGMNVDGALNGDLNNNVGADGNLNGGLHLGVIGKGGASLPGLGMDAHGKVSAGIGSGLPSLNVDGAVGGTNVDKTNIPSGFLNADGSMKVGQGNAGFPGVLIDVKGEMHMGSNNGPLVVVVDGVMKLGGSNGTPLALGGKDELHLSSENGPLLSVLANGKMQLGSGGPFLALEMDASMHLGSLQGPLLSINGQGQMQLNNGGLNNGPLLEILANGEMHLGSHHGPILKVYGNGLMDLDTGKGFVPFFLSVGGVMRLHNEHGPIFSIKANGEMHVGEDSSSKNTGSFVEANGSAKASSASTSGFSAVAKGSAKVSN